MTQIRSLLSGNILRSRFVRVLATVVALGFGAATALAQTAGGIGEPDPPGRVGRISYLSGPVQMTDLLTGQADAATLNWPITSSVRLSTGRVGRAEVRIGSLAARLDDDTVVDFTRIDDEVMQLAIVRGSVALRVRNRDHLRELDLLTPRERIVLEDVGRFRLDVDRTPGITAVTSLVGRARIISGRLSFVVASGQRGEIETSPVTSFRLVEFATDAFDDWVAARDRHDDSLRSAQYVSPETTGMDALDDHGTWRTVDVYGAVWFPTYVAAGWAPYRYGHWAWVTPWGWTWIDDAPWGFAPFHYGRWLVIGGVWGWVPGAIATRPVYAPALVAWFGGPGYRVGIGVGLPGVSIGWFPLGPSEVYIPPYRHSRHHLDVINVQHVTNIINIRVVNPPPRYLHRDQDRSTWAPGNAFVDRSPVNRVRQPPPSDWERQTPGPRPPVDRPREIKKPPTRPLTPTGPRLQPEPPAPARPQPPTLREPTPREAPVREAPTREPRTREPTVRERTTREPPTLAPPVPAVRPPMEEPTRRPTTPRQPPTEAPRFVPPSAPPPAPAPSAEPARPRPAPESRQERSIPAPPTVAPAPSVDERRLRPGVRPGEDAVRRAPQPPRPVAPPQSVDQRAVPAPPERDRDARRAPPAPQQRIAPSAAPTPTGPEVQRAPARERPQQPDANGSKGRRDADEREERQPRKGAREP